MIEAANSSKSTIKVVIADDHKLLRHAVKDILENSASKFTIVGEAGNADEALKVVETEHPDILVLDIGLPNRSGLDVLLELKRKGTDTKIVVLSMYDEETKVKQALAAGTDGYLLKNSSPEEIVSALASVVSGKKFVPSKFSHLLMGIAGNGKSSAATKIEFDPLEPLSPREREMFFLIVEGLPNRTIAKKLFISPRTVETHRARVIKKLHLTGNADLIRYAIKNGLVVV